MGRCADAALGRGVVWSSALCSTAAMDLLDTLLGSLRRCCDTLPDPRRGANCRYTMADIGLAAFSVFFTQSPSFLAHQRHLEAGHGRSHARTLFGLDAIPTDNHIRAMLDPLAPDHLFPV